MAAEQVHLYRQKVINTDTYKGLSFLKKSFVRKRNNIKAIQHALSVINYKGFDHWEKEHKTSYLNKLIIKELIKND